MILQARNINKYYSGGKERLHVLKDINLVIEEGKIVAIVGPSGAGKSTLLHILGGLDRPTSGEVLFEGRLFKRLTENELSRIRSSSIGFVFQFYHLMPEFTVLENVMMAALITPAGKAKPIKQKAMWILDRVGLVKRFNHFPAQLSGGEQQRAAIARALINEPRLLLCDEPTGNLDSDNGMQICSLLKKFNQEKAMTVVLVTHNLDVAALASRVYNIKDGLLH